MIRDHSHARFRSFNPDVTGRSESDDSEPQPVASSSWWFSCGGAGGSRAGEVRQERFDLVVEIRTLQSLPVEQRASAAAAICKLVSAGGVVWVRCLTRGDNEQLTERPWPVSREELRAFQDAGLRELELRHELATPGRSSSLTAIYQRD